MDKNKTQKEFLRLVEIMQRLRAKKGCPWDRKQTHKSLLPYILEEAYEVIEEINKNDKVHMKEELGDLLLQVVFHAQIAAEAGDFTIAEVAKGISDKLVTRHPHIFGNKKLKTAAAVREFWEKHKKEVKKRDSVIDGVPVALPALLRARRLQSKAISAGFKWKNDQGIIAKINEELAEVKQAVKSKKKKHIEEEIGDLLFAVTLLGYHYGVNAAVSYTHLTLPTTERV